MMLCTTQSPQLEVGQRRVTAVPSPNQSGEGSAGVLTAEVNRFRVRVVCDCQWLGVCCAMHSIQQLEQT